MVGVGALAPVDVTRIIALAHRSHTEHLVSEAAADRARSAHAFSVGLVGQRDRIYGRIDDEVPLGGNFPGFLEQTERKPSGHAKAHVAVAAAARRGPSISRN